MEKDMKIFIQHIIDSIDKIEEFTKDISKSDFLASVKTQDAVIRRLEIIGEAAKNISDKFKKKYNYVPWSEMARTRNKLIHKYFGVDLDLTWDIVKKDLPDLKRKMKRILEEIK